MSLFISSIFSTVYGQEKIDEYTSSYLDKTFDINVSQDKKDTSKFSYYIDCSSADALHKKVELMFDSKDLPDFIEFLNNIKATYSKWKTTAKENKVTELDKDIDVKEFKGQAAFIYGDWNFDFSVKLKPRAKIVKGEMLIILRSEELISSSNQFMKHDGFYLVFSSVKEIDEFIEKISIEKVKEYFRKKNKKDDLFN